MVRLRWTGPTGSARSGPALPLRRCFPASGSSRSGEPTMLISCWSVKGGVGTTVVAAALAVQLAGRHPAGALAIDLAGDLPTALGVNEPAGPGVAGWLAARGEVPADAIARLEQPAAPGLSLVHRGVGPLRPTRAALLSRLLMAEPRPVVVDCGRLDVPDRVIEGVDVARTDATEFDAPPPSSVARLMAEAGSGSLLVLRPCFLALRRACMAGLRPTGLVVVLEDGRAITTA